MVGTSYFSSKQANLTNVNIHKYVHTLSSTIYIDTYIYTQLYILHIHIYSIPIYLYHLVLFVAGQEEAGQGLDEVGGVLPPQGRQRQPLDLRLQAAAAGQPWRRQRGDGHLGESETFEL